MSSNPCNLRGWRPLSGRPGCVWLLGCKVKIPCGLGLAYGL